MANEKRLIDANALMAEHCDGCAEDIKAECKTNPICGSMMWIVEAPTVDAVEVVRCRDCIMYEEHINERTRFCRLNLGHSYADPNGFCSYGERRKNADD